MASVSGIVNLACQGLAMFQIAGSLGERSPHPTLATATRAWSRSASAQISVVECCAVTEHDPRQFYAVLVPQHCPHQPSDCCPTSDW